MRKLKSIVYSNIRKLTASMMIIILIVSVFVLFMAAQNQTKSNAKATFAQVEQIINENQAELVKIEEEYRETCLLNAETISYIIDLDPSILGNIEEFRLLARKMQVDEIHIFDNTGRIFTGTHPEYFNFTFDSGAQMNFFKPMLSDKSLRLCQDITPNTAEKKLVQYSALWNESGEYIVQVGMYPEAVLETTEKNELSYIFSLLKGNPGVNLYAIDSISGIIVGSTSGVYNGSYYNAIGFNDIYINTLPEPKHISINGVNSYCIFENVNDTVIVYVVSSSNVYNNILPYTIMLALCLIVIAAVLIYVVQRFTDSYIISSISLTNKKLREVSSGDLDERVDIQTSVEFSELSSHINSMIATLIANSDKMSFILESTNMPIGVYEYDSTVNKLRLTEHIPEILGLSSERVRELAGSCSDFKALINRIKQSPVSGMDNTYLIDADREKYVKLEEMVMGNDTVGIIIDETEEVLNLKRAEEERDVDVLTGLYNRRGMERRFDRLFYTDSQELGKGAFIVIDLDDMKAVNDTYGHNAGDIYLQGYAKMLEKLEAPKKLAARQGGDEFVLLVYGFEDDGGIDRVISRLRQIQDREKLTLEEGTEVVMRFSFGYKLLNGSKDYNKLISYADEYMYNSKRARKRLMEEKLEVGKK